jgi:hypothetical protein
MCKYDAMKILRILIVTTAIAGLVSCGGSDTADTATTITTVAATTTVPAPDCSKAAIELGVGEPTDVFECAGDWAAIMPNSYSGSCTECEALWLYKWESGAWNLKGSGNQYAILSPNSGFGGMTGLLKDRIRTGSMTEFPSKEVACALWPVNRYPENVAETGCTPDPAN